MHWNFTPRVSKFSTLEVLSGLQYYKVDTSFRALDHERYHVFQVFLRLLLFWTLLLLWSNMRDPCRPGGSAALSRWPQISAILYCTPKSHLTVSFLFSLQNWWHARSGSNVPFGSRQNKNAGKNSARFAAVMTFVWIPLQRTSIFEAGTVLN